MAFGDLPERLERVRQEIARAQAEGGWSHPVTIVAVTKGFGGDAVASAVAAGVPDVGENRVQEAIEKMAAAPAAARWHLIGHLQRNKAKLVPGRFVLVHAVDSLELADELERRAQAAGTTVPVLLQVNVAREAQKAGCDPDAAPELARAIGGRASGALRLDGLMTMAPFTDDVDVQRRTFRGLRMLRDALQEGGLWLPILSMGMSGDYATAVAEGATVVRLGTVLFGPRTTR